jgi:hypothetical protein
MNLGTSLYVLEVGFWASRYDFQEMKHYDSTCSVVLLLEIHKNGDKRDVHIIHSDPGMACRPLKLKEKFLLSTNLGTCPILGHSL